MCPLYGGVLTLGVSKHANVAFGTVISVLISEVQISEVPLPPDHVARGAWSGDETTICR